MIKYTFEIRDDEIENKAVAEVDYDIDNADMREIVAALDKFTEILIDAIKANAETEEERDECLSILGSRILKRLAVSTWKVEIEEEENND